MRGPERNTARRPVMMNLQIRQDLPLAILAALVAFVLVHLYAVRLRFRDGLPRSIWLSIAGGVSVAYVFVHVLPELNAEQEAIGAAVAVAFAALEHHVYLIALAGLAVF